MSTKDDLATLRTQIEQLPRRWSASGHGFIKLEDVLALLSAPVASTPRCTSDPNTCNVGYCDWPKCQQEVP